jgi:hypothetical protein
MPQVMRHLKFTPPAKWISRTCAKKKSIDKELKPDLCKSKPKKIEF